MLQPRPDRGQPCRPTHPKEYAWVSYRGRYLLWVSIYSFFIGKEKHKWEVLTQRDRVGSYMTRDDLVFKTNTKGNRSKSPSFPVGFYKVIYTG